jgi:signal peptidase I
LPSKRVKLFLVVTVLTIAAGVAGVIAYRVFVVQLVRVPTGAMANTIIPGDHLIIKKRFFGSIKRGDIIVFTYTEDATT